MSDYPFFYRPLLFIGVGAAILLIGATYWTPWLQLPSAQNVAAALMQPLTSPPPEGQADSLTQTEAQAQDHVAIKTEVAKAEVVAVQAPVKEQTQGAASAQSTEVALSNRLSEAEVASPAKDPDSAAGDVVHEGDGKEGLELAAIDIAGRQDTDSIRSWLAAGFVVLEIEANGRTYVALANEGASSDVFASLRFTPIAAGGTDQRSELRVVYRKGASPIRAELLELRMTQQGISDPKIDKVDVVFTNAALALFKHTQDAILGTLAQQGRKLKPENLRLAVCFTATHDVGVKAVTEAATGQVLLLPGTCP